MKVSIKLLHIAALVHAIRRYSPSLQLLKAALATTSKVTDQGWRLHTRQMGLTSLSPRCNLVHRARGEHRRDADAGIIHHADIDIVADWADCVPYRVKRLEQILG